MWVIWFLAGEFLWSRPCHERRKLVSRIKTAGPSIPVEILGLPDAPMQATKFLVVSDEKKAREVAEFRATRERQKRLERQAAMRLENIMAQMGKKDVPTVNIVLKTDVRGSLEASPAPSTICRLMMCMCA
jgi:translation initiation factor IF-2